MGSTWLALAPSWSVKGPGLLRAPGPEEDEESFRRVSVSAAKLSEGLGGRGGGKRGAAAWKMGGNKRSRSKSNRFKISRSC